MEYLPSLWSVVTIRKLRRGSASTGASDEKLSDCCGGSSNRNKPRVVDAVAAARALSRGRERCWHAAEYFEEGSKGSPFSIGDLKPIQMPNMDLDGLFEGRRGFVEAQWIDVLCRSTGMEPTNLDERVKWHLLARMIPFVENDYKCVGAHKKKPQPNLFGVMGWGYGLGFECWWRRRELNPRPQALCRWSYMLSPLYCF